VSLRAALRIIAADKARLALALSVVAVVATTAVTFGSWSVLSQAVGAGATVTFSLAGKVAMSNASDNSCQGAVFTVPITLAATS
jgi:hypothetical protein